MQSVMNKRLIETKSIKLDESKQQNHKNVGRRWYKKGSHCLRQTPQVSCLPAAHASIVGLNPDSCVTIERV